MVRAIGLTGVPVLRTIIAAVLGLLTMLPAARAEILIAIDKGTQSMTVSVDGHRRWLWPVSTGRIGYTTPAGSYRAFRMEEDHYSKEWDEAPMPHSIFFTRQGHAIHGTYETRRLGSPASHGCVRLSTQNAAALFALVRQRGVTNTQVVVTGSEDFRRAPAIRRARPYEPPAYEIEPVPLSPPRPWPPFGY